MFGTFSDSLIVSEEPAGRDKAAVSVMAGKQTPVTMLSGFLGSGMVVLLTCNTFQKLSLIIMSEAGKSLHHCTYLSACL